MLYYRKAWCTETIVKKVEHKVFRGLTFDDYVVCTLE